MTPAKLADFKTALEALVEDAKRSDAPNVVAGFAGERAGAKLEHNVRRLFLDRLLADLGWTIDVNVVEEARVKGNTTLFLDYLGVHVEERTPLLIFEAKAGDKPFVTGSSSAFKKQSPAELISLALQHIKSEATTEEPVISDWLNWLKQLHGYVNKLREQSGHVVSRVAIANESWLVIFTDPALAFIGKADVPPGSILVFEEKDFVSQSDHIYTHLAYGNLVEDIPHIICPTQLSAFIAANAVKRVFQALWISWRTSGSSGMGDTYPQIVVYPAVVVERSDQKLLHLADKRYGKSDLATNPEFLAMHLAEIARASGELLASIFSELGREFPTADIEEFAGFPSPPVLGSSNGLRIAPVQISYLYQWQQASGEFLLVTGNSPHFVLEHSAIADCLWHDWSNCHGAGFPADVRISASSIKPKSYFSSGAEHHCAHSAIHNRRAGRCYIEPFETYLCCRACTFNEICWPRNNTPPMPCGVGKDQYREALVAGVQN